ncbi:1,2-phenylacetyl-CoA epoxidase subunit PaaC [Falsarthrobacter nasiphocae]|uniref:1,2-phenylacetyl-CoA epoxidase subunit PaaC n=1 Tax=Falsarthrobacter nasiphocae TaxID=189863 RepID=UPI002869F69A|nr:1,2-phenylacetyl-CoA epoxidase subunit PaaC [Falsarthrobacter nasiphocae]
MSVGVHIGGAGSEATASATRITPGFALRPEDIAIQTGTPDEDTAQYALALGDDALILAQRLAYWVSRAPELEEDIALGNIALDTLGHARSFLTYAGRAWGKTEDDLAYFRDEDEFRSIALFEQPTGDFGRTIARQLVVGIYFTQLYSRLEGSTDETLAGIAAKAVKETAYHADHAEQWVLRLGLGTDESRERLTRGLAVTWPAVDELFRDTELTDRLAERGIAVAPSSLREPVMAEIERVLGEAELSLPDVPAAAGGGRRGEHSEHLGYILAEMQVLARSHPGASW